jgi:DinB superfamily
MKRPEPTEYAEFYAGYVSLVEETDIVSALQAQLTEIEILFAEMLTEKADYRYAPEKWSVKQLLGHMIDGERVFAYRALRIARNDKTPLPGFDENAFMENSNFNERKIADLLEEFLYLRQANNIFFKTLNEDAWSNVGTASNAQVSVRAIAYVMVGHVRHHINILRERYSV